MSATIDASVSIKELKLLTNDQTVTLYGDLDHELRTGANSAAQGTTLVVDGAKVYLNRSPTTTHGTLTARIGAYVEVSSYQQSDYQTLRAESGATMYVKGETWTSFQSKFYADAATLRFDTIPDGENAGKIAVFLDSSDLPENCYYFYTDKDGNKLSVAEATPANADKLWVHVKGQSTGFVVIVL